MAKKIRSKSDVVSTEAVYRGEKRNGHQRRYGTRVTFKDGTITTLLTPSGKGAKFAKELHEGVRYTNDGYKKLDEYGYTQELTDSQRAYRSGFLQAQKDSARLHKAKKK